MPVSRWRRARQLDDQVAHLRRMRLWRRGLQEHLAPVIGPAIQPPGVNEVILGQPWSDLGVVEDHPSPLNLQGAWNVFYATRPWWGGGSWSGRNLQ